MNIKNTFGTLYIIVLYGFITSNLLFAQKANGPYGRLIIRNAMMIDGTGAPVRGPVDIVIEKNIITEIASSGLPWNLNDPSKRVQGATYEIDAKGMFVTPGFIDTHMHLDYPNIGYDYKLYLAHGVTTIRHVGFSGGLDWSLNQRKLSEENKIIAPRIIVCAPVGEAGSGWDGRKILTPEDGKKWVQHVKQKGVDCIGEIGSDDPDIMKTVLNTADSLGLPSMIHIGQNVVTRLNGKQMVELGLDELTHYYGIFESLLNQGSMQNWPLGYNYSLEYDRFRGVPFLKDQIYPVGGEKWNELIEFFLKNNVVLSPTFTIYSPLRDEMRARRADWQDEYTTPQLWNEFQPTKNQSHSMFYHKWESSAEADWQNFFNLWFKFVKDYNQAGGKVTVGTDVGALYQVYGFSNIHELELLLEAGLTPVEVIRSATLYGAESIFKPDKKNGKPIEYGILAVGKKADILIHTLNPLEDFTTLYGTGALRLNEKTNELERVRSLRYTIKDGIIYDTTELLEEVRTLVKEQKGKIRMRGLDVPVIMGTPEYEKLEKMGYN